MTRLVCSLAMLAMVLAVPARGLAAIDFDKEIRPILAKSCYECHGPEKQKGDLRLDTKEGFLVEDYILVPKKADESELYVRISLPADHDDIMPPKGDPLSKDQQELIKKWIEEGGSFGDWTVDAEAAAGAKKVELPKVDPADPKAIEELVKLGALAMPLAKDTNLLNVDFRAVAENIGDSHLAKLQPIAEQIAWLNLGRTKITDDGLEQLEDMKHLSRLHLENTAITDDGVAHLKALESLEYLNLYGTKVTDTTLRHLKRLKNLRKVYVWQTAVTEQKAKELMEDMDQLEVNTGWKAPPPSEKKEEEKKAETATVADAKAGSKPVNGKCPVSGKDIDAEKLVAYKGNVIAFCCDMCKGKFEADPEKFIAKVDGFKAEEAKPAAEAKPADAPKPEAKAKKGKGKGKKKKD